MSKQEVILCENLESSIGRAVENCPHDRLFILTDDHTHRLCLSQLMKDDACSGRCDRQSRQVHRTGIWYLVMMCILPAALLSRL